MKKMFKAISIAILAVFLSAGFQYGKLKEADAKQCYYPFMHIDKTDELYNHAVCQGNFQVYYFPVIADGRKYTITLHSVAGEQKLFASRYKNEVDELSDIVSWRCNDDHCDSSTEVGNTIKIVSFRSPEGENSYYSWIAVYGLRESAYQIGISNNGILRYVVASNEDASTKSDSAVHGLQGIAWKALSPENFLNIDSTGWTATDFSENGWQDIALPNKNGWGCDNCYRRYRGTFYLDGVNNSAKVSLTSDDGIWVYVNGRYLGHWGGDSSNPLLCVNSVSCFKSQTVGDLAVGGYLKQGKNVISAIVYDGGGSEYFDLSLK